MQVYLITDVKNRVHQFIYPDRVWEETPDGWITRSIKPDDHQRRLAVCRGLVKNAIAGRRLMPAQGLGPQAADTEEESNDAIH